MSHYIRLATASDSEDILNIYSPYVSGTAISFELDVPEIPEFSRRVVDISQQYPYLVYTIDGVTAGYAYASRHRERAAYCYDVDVSIYVSPEYHGSGIAVKLYGCLFDILKELGYYNAYAICTVPNEKSMHFHQKLGFTHIGTYHKTGYKFGKWHDVAVFEKHIIDHGIEPVRIKIIKELAAEHLDSILTRHI